MAADLLVLRLESTPDAPRRARSELAEWLAPRVEREELERTKLLVSELVTNAVLHGEGEIRVRADVNQDRLLVEVIDEGAGFEHEIRAHDFDAVGGWGLTIVDSVASRWGVHEGTTHVWADIALR